MQASSSQYLSLAKCLLVPPRAWRVVIMLYAVAILVTTAYFEVRGSGGAVYTGVTMFVACLGFGFLFIPSQMRLLLLSKAFLLCAPSVRVLITVAAVGLGVWVTLVTMLALKDGSFMALRIAVVFWAIASVAMFFFVVFPKFIFVFIWGAVVGFNYTAGFNVLSEGSLYETSLIFSVLAACAGILAWFLLYRVSVNGRINRNVFFTKSLTGGYFAFSSSTSIKLGSSELEHFLKLSRNSGYPVVGVFLMALSVVLIGYPVMGFIESKDFYFQLSEDAFKSGSIALSSFLVVLVYGVVQAMANRLRSLWLVLPGDRLQLARHIDRAQFLIVPAVISPIALLFIGLVFFGALPLLSAVQTIIILLVSVALFYYWSFYIYGRDAIWSGLGSLCLLIVAAIHYGVSVAITPLHPLILVGLAVGVSLCLFLRFKVYQRWAHIDFTVLRANRPL